jgi:hypothetical protein
MNTRQAGRVIEVGATGISEPREIAEMAVAGLAYGKAASVGASFISRAAAERSGPSSGGLGAGGAAIPTAGNAETSGQTVNQITATRMIAPN